MAHGNEVLTLLNNGPSDVITGVIIGSLRSLQPTTLTTDASITPHVCHTTSARHNTTIQTLTPTLMIDRQVPTKDIDILTKYSKNVDVRHFKSIRDRLINKYLCNRHHCPVIKERLEQHQERCCRRTPRASAEHHALLSTHNADMKHSAPPLYTHKVSTRREPSKNTVLPRHSSSINSNNITISKDLSATYDTMNLQQRSSVTERGRSERKTSIKHNLQKELELWLQSVLISHADREWKQRHAEEIRNFIRNLEEISTGDVNYLEQKQHFRNEIVTFLNALPMRCRPAWRESDSYKDNLIDNLINRIRRILSRRQCKSTMSSLNQSAQHLVPSEKGTQDANIGVSPALSSKSCEIVLSSVLLNDTDIFEEVTKCFREANLKCHNAQIIIRQIEIILENLMNTFTVDEQIKATDQITRLLTGPMNISEALASHVAQKIMKTINNIYVGQGKTITSLSHTSLLPPLTRTLSVFMSKEHCSTFDIPSASTPKTTPMHKTTTKFNCQEKKYMAKVSDLIRAWIDTLPETFSAPEDKSFKETIIQDLAGDIMDEHKVAQLTSDTEDDRHKYLKYILYRWVHRLEELDINEVVPHIEQFLSKLNDIPVPDLTCPQGGNCRAKEKVKHTKSEQEEQRSFVTEALDALQDEISSWVNQQSSDIFQDDDQTYRQNKIRDLAITLENKFASGATPSDISKDIAQWLNNMVTLPTQPKIQLLARDLKEKIIDSPQDTTLINQNQNTKDVKDIDNNTLPQVTRERRNTENIEQDQTIKIFLDTFLKHSYEVDDPMARIAANQLLKLHMKRLNPPVRDDIYNDNVGFPSQQVMRELEYIKDISDWLSNIPMDAAYNTVGNRERVEFVTNLAANIRDVEEQRESDPDAMDYNMYMAGIISQFMSDLPIPKEYTDNKSVTFMIDQLLTKIIAHRQEVSNKIELTESLYTTGVNTDNIGDFIEEFIRINGSDIADNELKLEIWALRLIREIRRTINDDSSQTIITKAQCYNNCMENVPLPGDESARLFSRELEYIEQISSWIKNLPLLPSCETEDFELGRGICELAEKIIEMNRNKTKNPNDSSIENDFEKYLNHWMSQLPLNKTHTINFSLLKEQLLRRLQKVNDKEIVQSDSYLDFPKEAVPVKIKKSKSTFKLPKGGQGSLGKLVIDVIEKWSRNLPIKAENENATKSLKADISDKLIHSVAELNMDPNVFNNDLIYQEKLTEHVQRILNSILENNQSQIQSNRSDIEANIVNAIMESKHFIQDKTAGDTYKLKLQNNIFVSMPDPCHYDFYDPGFEMYKNRLATLFILENFDLSIDEVKTKYENNVKKEIDKYFEHAQNKNSMPLSKEDMYNELYSALYKVPIPNEASIIDEVEELKTRCEVDSWFEQLPLREAEGVGELLEWDKILCSLAKRIHDIEKSENKSEQRIKKEILKSLAQLPLMPDIENNADHFAEILQKSLKSSATQRKCVLSKKNRGKKDKEKNKSKEHNIPLVNEFSPSIIVNHNSRDAVDIISEFVQSWCDEILLCTDQDDAQTVRDVLATKIMMKISELNADSVVLNVDSLYDRMLRYELEILLATVNTCASFKQTKDARINQLVEDIKSVKPLIIAEIARHDYRENLNKNIDRFLIKPPNLTEEKETLLAELKSDIVDNFVQYKYDYHNDDKYKYKINIEENISKFLADVLLNKEKDKNSDYALIKSNQLISELAKVPARDINFQPDIEEIRMKNEVNTFFKGLSLKTTEKSKVNQSKMILAKKLNDIEMSGHSAESENKMKQEIFKCLSNLNKEVKPQTVDMFITKLRNTEAERRSLVSQLQVDHTNNNNIITPPHQNLYYFMDFKPQENVLKTTTSSTLYINDDCEYSTARLITNPRNLEKTAKQLAPSEDTETMTDMRSRSRTRETTASRRPYYCKMARIWYRDSFIVCTVPLPDFLCDSYF